MNRFLKYTGYVGLALCAINVYAVNYSWSNASGGNFTNGSNWVGGNFPSNDADRATIDVGGSFTIDITETITNNEAYFQGNNQTVTLNISAGKTYECIAEATQVARTGNTTNTVILTSGTWDVGNTLVIGQDEGDVGTILVDGGHLTSDTSECRIGRDGTGYLNITNGSIDMNTTVLGRGGWGAVGCEGFMNVWGGAVTSKNALILGQVDDSEGTVNIYAGRVHVPNSETRIGQDGTGTVNVVGGVFDCSGRNINVSRGGWGGRGVGYLNVQGGSVTSAAINVCQESEASTPDDITEGTVHLSGGSITVSGGNISVGKTGTGRFKVSGGTLYMPGPNGVRIADNTHSNAFGYFDVIGTNGTIDLQYYFTSTYTNSDTRFFFADGGISPLHGRNDVDIRGGDLTLGMKGYMDVIMTTSNAFITGDIRADSHFDNTNASIFTVEKFAGTQWVARADSSFEVYAPELSTGTTITEANKGWFDFNTNNVSGSTFDMYFRLVTNGISGSLSDLITEMQSDGHATAVNIVSGSSNWLKVTYSTPTWSSPRFGFDFSSFDSNLKVDYLAIDTIPRNGSGFRFQ